MVLGLVTLPYFIYQDIHIVKIPQLFYSRLIFIVPFFIYIIYMLVVKEKKLKTIELLHTVFLCSLLIMSASMLATVIYVTNCFCEDARHATIALIVNTFAVYIIAGISLRWLHIIIGIPYLFLLVFFILDPLLNVSTTLEYLSNFGFISILLLIRAIQLVHSKFYRYELEKQLEESNVELKGLLSENIKLSKKLEFYAMHDELTGAIPRNIGMETLILETKKADRNQYCISILFIDIDGLKIVNDKLGHKKGDQLIKDTIDEFKRRIRESDYIIRYGGDEFLIILPNCSETVTQSIVSNVRSNLLELNNTNDIIYSFSEGYSQYKPNSTVSIEELIKISDEKMYRVKKAKKLLLDELC